MNHASDTLTLHNGVEMPLLGLGVMHMYGSECVRAIGVSNMNIGRLEEVIAAAERADCLVDTTGVFYLTVAVKFGHKLFCLTVYFHFLTDKRLETETIFAHNHTRRHIAMDMLVECMIVNLGEFAKIEDAHTATDVNANYIGNYLVAEVACKPYDATSPGVYIRHDAYLLVGKYVNRKQFLDLLQGVILDIVRKYLYVMTFYCDGY